MAMAERKRTSTAAARAKSRKKGSEEIVIPDKLFFRIGDVAKIANLPTYVLRFWETEFPHLKPTKASSGQRVYRRKDVENVLQIRKLLHEEGYTIAGARQWLQDQAKRKDKTTQTALPFLVPSGNGNAPKLKQIKGELQEIVNLLKKK